MCNPSISPWISHHFSPQVVHVHCQQKLDAAREQLETVWEEVLQQVRGRMAGQLGESYMLDYHKECVGS
jgi:hypothetical protein